MKTLTFLLWLLVSIVPSLASANGNLVTGPDGKEARVYFQDNVFKLTQCNSGKFEKCSSKSAYNIGTAQEFKMRLLRQNIDKSIRGKLNIDLEFTDIHTNQIVLKNINEDIARITKFKYAIDGRQHSELLARKTALENTEIRLKALPEYAQYLKVEKEIDNFIKAIENDRASNRVYLQKFADNFFLPEWKSGVEDAAYYADTGSCRIKIREGKSYFMDENINSDFVEIPRLQMMDDWRYCLAEGHGRRLGHSLQVNDAERASRKNDDRKTHGNLIQPSKTGKQ